MAERARITLPDLVYILFALAFLGALYPVFFEALDMQAPNMMTGSVYIYQLILPLALLVMLTVIYVKATAGGP